MPLTRSDRSAPAVSSRPGPADLIRLGLVGAATGFNFQLKPAARTACNHDLNRLLHCMHDHDVPVGQDCRGQCTSGSPNQRRSIDNLKFKFIRVRLGMIVSRSLSQLAGRRRRYSSPDRPPAGPARPAGPSDRLGPLWGPPSDSEPDSDTVTTFMAP